MKTRIISGLVMAPFLILVIIGGPLISILCLFIALMGMREFFNGFKAMGDSRLLSCGGNFRTAALWGALSAGMENAGIRSDGASLYGLAVRIGAHVSAVSV